MAPALFYVFLVFGVAPEAQDTELYQTQRSARLLKALGFEEEPDPEGKKIRFVRILPHEVFVADEPYPLFLNRLRIRTRDEVIEREMLFREGDSYEEARIAESTRILRGMGIFSLVTILTVRTENPGEVGVIVFTRDLWSLRIEQAFQLTGRQIDEIAVQLTERNLLGRGKLASLSFQLFPLTFSVGQLYNDRRLFGSSLSFFESVRVIVNREKGDVEGSVSQLWFGRPLYSLGQSWSWGFSAAFDEHIARQVQTGEVLTYDIPETVGVEEEIPRVWDYRGAGASAAVTRQYGVAWKQRISGGIGALWTESTPNDQTALEPEQSDAFTRDVLPDDSREVYPLLSYSLFKPVYYSFENLSTFGQSEDVRVGPSFGASLRIPLVALGSTDDAVGFGLGCGYVYAESGSLAQISLSGSGELLDGEVVDQVLGGLLRGATPHLFGARLAARLGWTLRKNYQDNILVSLGGNNGLRGYPSQAFQDYSAHGMLGSLELRTLPLVYRSVHTGFVFFYDAGSVYKNLDDFRLHQSVGLGARVLLPQLNRFAYRIDLGIPLDGQGFSVLLMIGRGQSLALTPADDAISR